MQRLVKIAASFSQGSALVFALAMGTDIQAGTIYNPATDFESGYVNQTNPNGVWSYGSSSGFTGPVSLYTQTVQNGVNGPDAQYWLSPSNNIGNSPSAEFNDGGAYNDGNVTFSPDQFVLVSGIGGEYSDLIFTAPESGIFDVSGAFTGDQYGIGTLVGIVADGTLIFNSRVTSVGQVVPFDADVNLTAGQTLEFSVGPDGGGLQNTGLNLQITQSSAVPEPSTLVMAFAGLLLVACSRIRRRHAPKAVGAF